MNTSDLEKTIGVVFKNKKLLKEAITHRSYLNENLTKDRIMNEWNFWENSVLE